jgi:hypothetical protein
MAMERERDIYILDRVGKPPLKVKPPTLSVYYATTSG